MTCVVFFLYPAMTILFHFDNYNRPCHAWLINADRDYNPAESPLVPLGNQKSERGNSRLAPPPSFCTITASPEYRKQETHPYFLFQMAILSLPFLNEFTSTPPCDLPSGPLLARLCSSSTPLPQTYSHSFWRRST
jgi:hypothetical protein